MIWNEHHECMEREELRKLQGERIRAMVERVYFNVPFYRRKLQDMGIEPGDIRTIDDLQKLPFTTKQDLRDNYPFGLFAVPQQEIVRLHASSGTTGKSTVVGYTHNDILMWSEVVARSLTMAGVSGSDIIQVAYGYGLFTGGLGLHYGAEKIGASVIPISGGNTKKQLQLMEDFGSTAIACTPSYAAYLGEALIEEKIDRKNIKLKAGIFGAEPWTEEMRAQIEQLLGLKAYDIYGLSEVIGPGVSMECSCQNGMHIFEDHFIPEIINPETGELLPYGELGELVFTPATKEAMPLLRYRTRDLTRLHAEPCQCGRTLVRMEKCVGRSDDMLIIRGVNVFPSQVEAALAKIGGLSLNYCLEVAERGGMKELSVICESERLLDDEGAEALRADASRKLHEALAIRVGVRVLRPETLERSSGKAVRVVKVA